MPAPVLTISIENHVAARLDDNILIDTPLRLSSPVVGKIETLERQLTIRPVEDLDELTRAIRAPSGTGTDLVDKQRRQNRQCQREGRGTKGIGPLQPVRPPGPVVVLGPGTISFLLEGKQVTMSLIIPAHRNAAVFLLCHGTVHQLDLGPLAPARAKRSLEPEGEQEILVVLTSDPMREKGTRALSLPLLTGDEDPSPTGARLLFLNDAASLVTMKNEVRNDQASGQPASPERQESSSRASRCGRPARQLDPEARSGRENFPQGDKTGILREALGEPVARQAHRPSGTIGQFHPGRADGGMKGPG